jgi:hypothetical protein
MDNKTASGEHEGTREHALPAVETVLDAKLLQNKLVSLALDWEVAALTLDAQRYKAHAATERESLRETANTYRKCVSELSEIISACSAFACRKPSFVN